MDVDMAGPSVPVVDSVVPLALRQASIKGKEKAVTAERDDNFQLASDDEGNESDDYEQRRQKRIMENQELLTSLGISQTRPPQSPQESTSASRKRPRRELVSKQVFDRSGHIISLPGPGESHKMACVEMPSDRALKRRIAEGEYQDCSHWLQGETRRWRFGLGRGGELQEDEPTHVGGVGPDFRWRKWRGLEKELRAEMRKRGLLNEMDSRRDTVITPSEEASAYSLLPMETCHQCRRRSEKLKMKCRNVDPPCKAIFCETCCKRYSYFDFDPESRSFVCPLCKDCCNCSNCIRKRNLAHLLGPGRTGIRSSALKSGNEVLTVQAWLEKEAQDKTAAPFDRVRLVDELEDIITPELPPETIESPIKTGKGKKGVQQTNKRTRGPGKKSTEPINGETKKIRLILKVGGKEPVVEKEEKPVKEVDSDGDTVGGWSDDEGDIGRRSGSETSEDDPNMPQKRFPFPPLPGGLHSNINLPSIPDGPSYSQNGEMLDPKAIQLALEEVQRASNSPGGFILPFDSPMQDTDNSSPHLTVPVITKLQSSQNHQQTFSPLTQTSQIPSQINNSHLSTVQNTPTSDSQNIWQSSPATEPISNPIPGTQYNNRPIAQNQGRSMVIHAFSMDNYNYLPPTLSGLQYSHSQNLNGLNPPPYTHSPQRGNSQISYTPPWHQPPPQITPSPFPIPIRSSIQSSTQSFQSPMISHDTQYGQNQLQDLPLQHQPTEHFDPSLSPGQVRFAPHVTVGEAATPAGPERIAQVRFASHVMVGEAATPGTSLSSLGMPSLTTQSSGWLARPQNLDLLSIAAAEAQSLSPGQDGRRYSAQTSTSDSGMYGLESKAMIMNVLGRDQGQEAGAGLGQNEQRRYGYQ
ncbi:hypothetical protein M231_03618 [Tremella mesenterica]|uniref:Zinc-finger domain-containing protein n=1 Tax=Tremella mesenterica TaxID=5217 RepID=A0A4Q1BMQ6_TREME|nr:hypothetical protein M231_03618 [Tremella mesenterica]